MSQTDRVLIIGLDGATWNVLGPWIEDGTLPHLAALRQNGAWGTLRSTIPPLSAPAWSTFMTGKRPGKHGVYHFINPFNPSPDGKREIVDARSVKSPALWDTAAHHGKRVGLINIPMTYPPRQVNGFMITGLLTPPHAAVFTYPPELSNELPGYLIDLERFHTRRPFQDAHQYEADVTAPSLELIQEFRTMLDKRAETALTLMEKNPWELFVVVFTGTDRMGHYLWDYHNAPAAAAPSDEQPLYQAVHDYYIRLDAVVGELLTAAGADASVIIMSDHGMGPLYTQRVHWNSWLHEHGWLTLKSTGNPMLHPDSWLKRLRIPRDKIGKILRRLPWISKSKVVKQADASFAYTVDEARSPAYCVPIYQYVFGIRLTAQGEARAQLRTAIMDALQQETDPHTGQPIIQYLYKGEDYYHGEWAVNIPDIVVVMYPQYVTGYRPSHYSALVTPVQSGTANQGDHCMEGIFLLSGPQITKPGRLADQNIEDIAPTALYLLDVPLPDDMDGAVLTAALDPEGLANRPIQTTPSPGFWPAGGPAFADFVVTEADSAEIEARLQSLGYL